MMTGSCGMARSALSSSASAAPPQYPWTLRNCTARICCDFQYFVSGRMIHSCGLSCNSREAPVVSACACSSAHRDNEDHDPSSSCGDRWDSSSSIASLTPRRTLSTRQVSDIVSPTTLWHRGSCAVVSSQGNSNSMCCVGARHACTVAMALLFSYSIFQSAYLTTIVDNRHH
jgi:hypothetical protein